MGSKFDPFKMVRQIHYQKTLPISCIPSEAKGQFGIVPFLNPFSKFKPDFQAFGLDLGLHVGPDYQTGGLNKCAHGLAS